MPRIRTLKPQFWDSPSTAKADLACRLLYMALWNWADDSGRGTANLKELEAFAFPNDDITSLPRRASADTCRISAGVWPNFAELFWETCRAYDVTLYEVSGRRFFEISSFRVHQSKHFRENSQLPGPEDGTEWDIASEYGLNEPGHDDDEPNHSNTIRRNSALSCRTSPLDRDRDRDRDRDNYPPNPPSEKRSRNGAALARQNVEKAPRRTPAAINIANQFANSRQSPPTETDLITIGEQITKALDQGIPPNVIAAGLTNWDQSDSWSPSQIGRFITKAGRTPPTQSPTDDKVAGWLSLATDHDTQEITQ